jgi:hypothetical protein
VGFHFLEKPSIKHQFIVRIISMPFKKIMKLKTHKNNEFMGAKPKIMYLAKP